MAASAAAAGALRLIEPVVARTELLRTLEALIAADGNRARAATDLIIHRSTIDYRLGRIEALTGHSPTRVRGLQTLCTALAAHTLSHTRSTTAPRRVRPIRRPVQLTPSGCPVQLTRSSQPADSPGQIADASSRPGSGSRIARTRTGSARPSVTAVQRVAWPE